MSSKDTSTNIGTIAGRFVGQVASILEDRFGYVHLELQTPPQRVPLTRYYEFLEAAAEHAAMPSVSRSPAL